MTEITDIPRGPLPRRCQRCAYVVEGLGTCVCPECGRVFDPGNPSTYSLRPPFAWWRLWLPGVLLALALGGGFTLMALALGSLGTGLTIGGPLAIGAITGYRVRAQFAILIMLVIVIVCAVALLAVSADFAGLFCGLVLGAILLLPAFFGVFVGFCVRSALRGSSDSYHAWLPVLVFILVPVIWIRLEGPAALVPPRRVATSTRFNATPEVVWGTLMFYEEVDGEPPLLLRLGLPTPQSTSGSMNQVGDVKVCVYDKGHLVKRIVEADAPRRLGFVVTDQHIGFERSVLLRGGSFTLDRDGDGTVVTLETVYTPLLRPRLVWSWSEDLAIHTLHEHVLHGMGLEVIDGEPHLAILATTR